MTFFHIENDVVPIPMLNLEIADHLRANAVNRDITVCSRNFFRRYSSGCSLMWCSPPWPGTAARERGERAVSRQHVDKISRPAGRKMLGDLEALHQIKPPPEINRQAQIGGAKLVRVDHQVVWVDIGAIDAHDIGTGFPPYAQPSALAAAKIGDAADRYQGFVTK